MEDDILIRITPEKAIDNLRKEGIDVNMEEAQAVLDLLYSIAKIVVEQYVNNRENGD